MALLWMDSDFGRPDSLVMWAVPVPPVPIRPSVPQESGGGSTEDDITIKLQEIVEMNNALRLALEKGATMKMVEEDWEFLQIQVALFINGETPGIPRQLVGPKAVRGLCQRLKGKQGRFRGNLSGKRVDFSGRTVISPDPNLRIEQVGVPVLVAKIMTYPERVNRYNIDRMRQLVLNGADIHPGANIVRSGNMVLSLQFADRTRVANNLKVVIQTTSFFTTGFNLCLIRSAILWRGTCRTTMWFCSIASLRFTRCPSWHTGRRCFLGAHFGSMNAVALLITRILMVTK
jgi:DNA-directed RNA polymerase III subunit RPC1